MSDTFNQRIKVVRLAQQIAQALASSKVPRPKWGEVLQLVTVIVNKGSSSLERGAGQGTPDGKD